MAALAEISLFSGAGGGVWASRVLGHRVVCYVEREPYCVRVLQARIADGSFDDAPIWDDVDTFDGRPWRGLVDVISAGFPCQPFSVAGSNKAGDDERNGWPSTARIIRDVRPRFCFLENVPGLLAGSHGYFGAVLGELAELGYDAEWSCLSAAQVGAPHKRDRLWVLATDATGARRPRDRMPVGIKASFASSSLNYSQAGGPPAWAPEPGLARLVDGMARRRIKALGNGQVPQCAVEAWHGLMRRHET